MDCNFVRLLLFHKTSKGGEKHKYVVCHSEIENSGFYVDKNVLYRVDYSSSFKKTLYLFFFFGGFFFFCMVPIPFHWIVLAFNVADTSDFYVIHFNSARLFLHLTSHMLLLTLLNNVLVFSTFPFLYKIKMLCPCKFLLHLEIMIPKYNVLKVESIFYPSLHP